MSGVVSFPTPPYSNPPIEPQYFAPWSFVISAITLGYTTTVTMIIPSITQLNYVVGQQVRLLIPQQYGCSQLNEQTAYVLQVNPPNQVVLDLDSHGGNPFVASSYRTPPQIVAIGDINSGPINNQGRAPTSTLIAGSFINISPN